jgi:hypothetical protein
MPRILLATFITLMTAPLAAHAVIVFDPSPVPTPDSIPDSPYGPQLDLHRQHIADSLRIPGPILPAPVETENYYRKADLLPAHLRSHAATPAGSPLQKGAILIIPKSLIQPPTPTSPASKA